MQDRVSHVDHAPEKEEVPERPVRPMKKVQLERVLQSLEPILHPAPETEQYATPPTIAAEVLYVAHGHGDVAGRSIADFGSGNGVLAIGAKLLGASKVVGVESDPDAVNTARRNAARVSVEVEWRLADVGGFHEAFDTILMNPPFGAQSRGADRPFLDAAIASGQVVYTFVNAKAEAFVRRRFEQAGGRVVERLRYAFPIPHLFPFHRDTARRFDVVLYRVQLAVP